MKLWADSDQLTEVRWFRCADDAEDLPYMHPYGSRNWVYAWPRDSLGEVEGERRAYDKGANPLHYAGHHFCGSQQAWEDDAKRSRDPAIATNDAGMAACCLGLEGWIQTPAGGLVAGGVAAQHGASPGHVLAPEGGLVVGGAAPQHGGQLLAPVGGLVVGGAAPQHGGQLLAPVGGLVVGGAAPQHGGGLIVPNYGLAIGGRASIDSGYAPSFVGGVVRLPSLASGVYTLNTATIADPGDIVLWIAMEQWAGAGPARIPAGYTYQLYGLEATNYYFAVAYRVIPATETLNYTWSAPGSTSYAVTVARIANGRPVAPVTMGMGQNAGTNTIIAPSITVPRGGATMVLAYFNSVAQSTGTPAGYTLIGAVTPGPHYHRSFYKDNQAAGATGNITVSCSTLTTKTGIQVCVRS